MGFTFGKNLLELEIEGAVYEIDPFSSEVLQGVGELQAKIDAAELTKIPDAEKVHELCGQVKDMVNTALGAGAYEEIFKGRDVNLLDHYQLAMHIMASVMGYRQARIAQFTIDGISTANVMLAGNAKSSGETVQ